MPGNPHIRRAGASRETDEARRVVRTGPQSSAISTAIKGVKRLIEQTNTYPASTPGTEKASGFVEMWAGSIADIPAGYQLCDGTNGTPDLRDRFILCVGAAEEPGTTGGALNHSHGPGTLTASIESPTAGGATDAHSTTAVQSGTGATVLSGPSAHALSVTVVHSHTVNSGTTETVSNVPPYFKLAFVMRVA